MERVYALLFYEKELYVVKYADGFELVGGRVEKDETLEEAMIRELFEETDLKPKNVVLIQRIGGEYVYSSERAGGQEKHFFFKIVANEKPGDGDARIVKINAEELLESIKYGKRKLFLKELFNSVLNGEH